MGPRSERVIRYARDRGWEKNYIASAGKHMLCRMPTAQEKVCGSHRTYSSAAVDAAVTMLTINMLPLMSYALSVISTLSPMSYAVFLALILSALSV